VSFDTAERASSAIHRDDIHEAFLSLAFAIICWRRLRHSPLC
jgi:hypothetical protein